VENDKKLWHNPRLVILLGVVAISFTATFVKFSTAPSIVVACYRMFFSALILTPVLIRNHRDEIKHLPPSTVALCGLSGICLALNFALYFESVRHTTIASATVLADTEVIIVAVIMLALWKETIPRLGAAGILIALLGSAVIAVGNMDAGNILRGDLLAALAAVFAAGYTIIGRTQRKSVSTTVYTFLVYLSSFLALALITAFAGVPLLGYENKNIAVGVALAVVCTLLGHSLFNWGLKYVKASVVSTAKLGEPAIATLLGVLFFREIPGIRQIAGGIIVIGGIYLYTFVSRD